MSECAGPRAGQAAAGQVCKVDNLLFVAIFTNKCTFFSVWVLSPQIRSSITFVHQGGLAAKANLFLHPRLLLPPLCPLILLLLQSPLRSSTRTSLVKHTSGYNSLETAQRAAEPQTDPERSVRSALCEVLRNISGMPYALHVGSKANIRSETVASAETATTSTAPLLIRC